MGVNNAGLNIFAGVPPLPSKHTGRAFFVGNSATPVPGGVTGVDSAGAYGDTPQAPFASIDYAVGQCTADRGDLIVALPGHIEAITAAAGLALDVAGVTVYFLGDGATRATIRFSTAVGADMNIDAANITLGAKGYDLGPRFLANIDALTGPIDVNAARFRMYGAKWYDGTTINTTDCVVADAGADNMEIEDFEFIDGDAAGTQKQSFIQIAAATGPILRKIKCTGDFGTGIIENGTAWIDALIDDVVLDNGSASPTVCVLLQATSTGWMRNSSLRVASGSTGYTANNDMQFDNVGVTGTDAADAADPVLGGLADTAATGAVTTTDTAMAYIKQLVTQIGGADADTNPIASMLAGAAGIATMPSAAVPANAVNMFELLREIWAVLNGTAAGENGSQAWPTAAAYANNVSIAEVLGYVQDAVRRGTGSALPANTSIADHIPKVITNTAATLVTGTTIFTIAGGPIEILHLSARCVTNNNCVASTLQWSADPTDGSAATISGASASLANAVAGAIVTLQGTALSTAALLSATTHNLGPTISTIIGAGILTTTIAVGSTTGTWMHHMVYRPLSAGVTVV